MDDKIDNFVDGIFGGGHLIYISGALGLMIIAAGIALLLKNAGDSKSKRTRGIICIIAGVGVILSGIAQTLLS